ncbi:alpha/beta hydrolase [Bacillus cereus]|uniref:alpha/beta hydrolase n=1 Tax=Bacillus cereus TaxID=1396 RepID=UPI000C28802E|nr:alpha/beta hydrolase family protein [Bacillus cereus]
MALLQLNFKSPTLEMQTNVTVILPENEEMFSDKIKPLQTLYLLHGLTNDNTIYTRYTNVERYAKERNLAVVMPNVDHSFYTDMKYGHDYFTFIQKELKTFLCNILPLSDKREDNFIAGHSMGGYGSFKLALTNPELYAAAACISGVVDINYFLQKNVQKGFSAKPIFGEANTLSETEHDLFYLLKENIDKGISLPKLYQICGTEDYLYEDNLKFRDFARNLNADIVYKEGSGAHDFNYWEYTIKEVINWLPLRQ